MPVLPDAALLQKETSRTGITGPVNLLCLYLGTINFSDSHPSTAGGSGQLRCSFEIQKKSGKKTAAGPRWACEGVCVYQQVKKEGLGTGRGCPGRWWRHCCRRCLRKCWMWHQVSWSCWQGGVWSWPRPGRPQGSFPTWLNLQFCSLRGLLKC